MAPHWTQWRSIRFDGVLDAVDEAQREFAVSPRSLLWLIQDLFQLMVSRLALDRFLGGRSQGPGLSFV